MFSKTSSILYRYIIYVLVLIYIALNIVSSYLQSMTLGPSPIMHPPLPFSPIFTEGMVRSFGQRDFQSQLCQGTHSVRGDVVFQSCLSDVKMP